MANVASLALPSPICGTEVAKVWPLLAHCTLHGTEGMAICFNIFWVTYNHTTFQLAGTINVNLVQLISQRLSDSLKAVRVRLTINNLAHLGCVLTHLSQVPGKGFFGGPRGQEWLAWIWTHRNNILHDSGWSSDALAGHFVNLPVSVLVSESLHVTGVCPFTESWHFH